MSILDELTSQRRSIRTYKADMPPEEWIAVLLRSAAKAPSPTNSRPVRFIRIKSPDRRAALHRAMHQGYQTLLEAAKTCEKPRRKTNVINAYWRYSEFIKTAPLLFAVGVATNSTGFSKRLFDAKIIHRDDKNKYRHGHLHRLGLERISSERRRTGPGNVYSYGACWSSRVTSMTSSGFPASVSNVW